MILTHTTVFSLLVSLVLVPKPDQTPYDEDLVCVSPLCAMVMLFLGTFIQYTFLREMLTADMRRCWFRHVVLFIHSKKKKNFEPKVYLIGVPEISAYSTCSNFPFLRPHCSRWDGKFLFEPHWHPLPLQGGFSCRSVFCTLSTVKNNTIGVCAVNEMQKLPTPEARLAVQHLLACWPYRKAEQ